MNKTKHKIIIGDSRRMEELSNRSVQLVVTSPPYWQLKDYGSSDQIGFNDSYEEYINHLNLVWNECYRVLGDGCRLCVNIGDQFARSVYYGRYKVIPIRTEIIRFCETIGFDYMGAIIWQKVTTCNTSGGGAVMGSFPYPRNGILKLDYEFILIFKKAGNSPKVSTDIKEASKMTTEEWNEYFQGHWNFAGERQNGHLAMFPEELPKRLIKMFTFRGETVLDPFLGSGTTTLAAKNLGRNSIGYEINKDFIPVISARVGIAGNLPFMGDKVEFCYQSGAIKDFSPDIEKLPYKFYDPIKFDKKIDQRKLEFGSRISKDSSSKRYDFHKVSKVLSPNCLILDKDLKVKLIGVVPVEGKEDEAICFLREKAQNQKVFIVFDEKKYDDEGNLLCYLYLANKTFVNAHLIKAGLTEPDEDYNYKYKIRFKKYMELCNA